jgi:hypothetical protein
MRSSISSIRAIVDVRILFEEGALNCSLLNFLDRPRPLQIERRAWRVASGSAPMPAPARVVVGALDAAPIALIREMGARFYRRIDANSSP